MMFTHRTTESPAGGNSVQASECFEVLQSNYDVYSKSYWSPPIKILLHELVCQAVPKSMPSLVSRREVE